MKGYVGHYSSISLPKGKGEPWGLKFPVLAGGLTSMSSCIFLCFQHQHEISLSSSPKPICTGTPCFRYDQSQRFSHTCLVQMFLGGTSQRGTNARTNQVGYCFFRNSLAFCVFLVFFNQELDFKRLSITCHILFITQIKTSNSSELPIVHTWGNYFRQLGIEHLFKVQLNILTLLAKLRISK